MWIFGGVFIPKILNYSTRAGWIRDDYSQLDVTRLVGYLSPLIIHRIFSLARDWSKRVTWVNIPQLKLGNIWGYSPIFNCARCVKDLKDNKDNSLHLGRKICSDICPWTLSVPCSSQFSSSYALWKLFTKSSEQIMSADKYPSIFFAPNGGYCLYIFAPNGGYCLLTWFGNWKQT